MNYRWNILEKCSNNCDEKIPIPIICMCSYFLGEDDLINLKQACKETYCLCQKNERLLFLTRNRRQVHQMEYWESCLGIDPNFPKYDSTYDRLKGYGFGEHFIEAEGTLGEIAKDVDRTFPQHILFEHRGGMGQDMLGNILKCFSEYAKLIGYCQGMNFVVGTMVIALSDPHIKGFDNNFDSNSHILKSVVSMSQCRIEKRVFELLVGVSSAFHMDRLWSTGIPDLKKFIFLLLQFIRMYCADVAECFDEMGYDISIVVTKWFLCLFSYNLPLGFVFRIWDYIFQTRWVGVMRVSVAILLYFREQILGCDIVEFSLLLKDIRENSFRLAREQRDLFDIMISLHDITEERFLLVEDRYEQEEEARLLLINNHFTTNERAEWQRRHNQITHDMDSIREQLESLSTRELQVKTLLKKYLGIIVLIDEEIEELIEHKQMALQQVEQLLYEDSVPSTMSISKPSMDDSERVRRSFLIQQDILMIRERVSRLGSQINEQERKRQIALARERETRTNWDALVTQKEKLKGRLLFLIHERASLNH